MQAAILRTRLPLLRSRTEQRRALAAQISIAARRRADRGSAGNGRGTRVSSLSDQSAPTRGASGSSSRVWHRNTRALSEQPFLGSRHSSRWTRPIVRTPFAPPTKCCRCPSIPAWPPMPSPRSLRPFERNHLRESVNHRRRRFHRVSSRRGSAQCRARSRHHRQPVDRLHPQRRPPEVESAIQVHHRHAHQRAAARRADRSQRRHLSFRRRRRREAHRRTAGAHHRDQRARHRSGAEAREQEEERRSSSRRRRRCTARARTCRFARTPTW